MADTPCDALGDLVEFGDTVPAASTEQARVRISRNSPFSTSDSGLPHDRPTWSRPGGRTVTPPGTWASSRWRWTPSPPHRYYFVRPPATSGTPVWPAARTSRPWTPPESSAASLLAGRPGQPRHRYYDDTNGDLSRQQEWRRLDGRAVDLPKWASTARWRWTPRQPRISYRMSEPGLGTRAGTRGSDD